MRVTFGKGEERWTKSNRFMKRSFMPMIWWVNLCYLLFWFLPFSLMQYGLLMYIVFMVLKWVRIPFAVKMGQADPKKSAFWLG